MGISPNAKAFLNNNAGLIKNVDFKTIYGPDLLGKWTRDPNLISEISQIFIKSGINPLKYLTTVPRYFLYGTELETIEIPNNIIEIDNNAFFDSDLIDVEIPDSVIEMGENIFYSCMKLKSIKFSKNCKIISVKTCFICKALENINIPEGVEEIKAGAFYICPKLKNITLPKSLKYIGENAFPDYLKDINYNGTKEEWKNVEINAETSFYKPLNPTVVHCIDGNLITKNLNWIEVD